MASCEASGGTYRVTEVLCSADSARIMRKREEGQHCVEPRWNLRHGSTLERVWAHNCFSCTLRNSET